MSECDECGSNDIGVSIEVRQEQKEGRNKQYSREPYRVETCKNCGNVIDETRCNNL